LIRNLFENTTFLSWARDKHRLHVFLDSLDECLLRIDTLAALLIDELKKYPIERLSLRIACRTADWPNSLETGLVQLWGKDAVGVCELTPLRRVDVIEAAKTNNLDHNVFLQEIDQKEVVPLAIKPVTLGFLISTYIKNGRFPSTQTELYLQGCCRLCDENNESRLDARLTGTFTIEQRLAVASRIAAITVFSNRYAIWIGVNRGDIPDEDTTIQELRGGTEDVDGVQFQVTEIAIKETIATGLFSSRGPNRMGWAHQTYAEFLAARYLTKHKMTLTQIMSLLVHPGDIESNLVPQLHEAAAWIAGMVPEVFRKITSVNPEVLLRSDIATADLKDRATLVESLLKVYDEEGLLDRDRDNRKRYKRLDHPGIADQLRPYICDSTKGIIVRRVAIDIAEACELQALQNDLANIALDQKETLSIREEAAYALGRIADDNTKLKLKPLATGEAGEDPDDELKGYSLQALWPEHMKVEELFDAITDIKQENFIGAYKMFLSHELVPKLKPSDLPIALKWVEQQESLQDSTYCFERLMDAIILKAWEHLDSPEVLEAFAKVVLSRFKHYDRIVVDHYETNFKNILSNEDSKRRRLLETILHLIPNPTKPTVRLVSSATPLVLSKDVTWMIERLRDEKSKKKQLIWAKLINWAFDRREPSQLDVIIDTCQSNQILAETFSWLLKPIELNSPEAEKMKADYLEIQKWQKQDKEQPLLNPLPAERIAGLLDECESDNSSVWWHLNRVMTLEPDSRFSGSDYESDLTALPGWKNADVVTRHRIVEAAKRYVVEQDPKTHDWLGKDIIHLPAFAGYRALQLLLQEIPDFISSLPNDIWKKWAPIILTYPTSNSDSNDKNVEIHNKLIKLSYQYALDEIIQTLMVMIDKENKDYDHVYITRKVEGCWDSRLEKALLRKVKDENLKPECMGDLLENLLNHGVKEAKAFAESLVSLPSIISEVERPKAIVAARELMLRAEDAGWSVVWRAIQQDVEFGCKVIESLAYESDAFSTNAGKLLTEDQLAVLYVWIAHQYPHAEDPKHNGAYWVGVPNFRDSLLQYLKQRGTPKACEAIQRIINEFPGSNWLKWVLHEAQDIMRRQIWIPSKPGEILKMSSNQSIRLVQNGEQLLEVLIESLKRLEAKLQDETPSAIELWNKIKKNKKYIYTPKYENEFSDYVKRRLGHDLKERGIIVNREVEIRRGEGEGKGERTDIHVNAVMRNQCTEVYDSITVIIEVKGCWNPDLNHAMKTQMMDRYLKDNRCQHGLYLVGWFNCDQWDDNDPRKQQSRKISIDEARSRFDTQAVELSQQSTRIKAFVMNTALRE
jgi:predicted NACHT family NTPase